MSVRDKFIVELLKSLFAENYGTMKPLVQHGTSTSEIPEVQRVFGLEVNSKDMTEIEARMSALNYDTPPLLEWGVDPRTLEHTIKQSNLKQSKENNMTNLANATDYIKGLQPTKREVSVSEQVNTIEKQLLAVRAEINALTKNIELDGRVGAYPVPVREKFVERYNKLVDAQLKDACKEHDALLDKLNRVEKLL